MPTKMSTKMPINLSEINTAYQPEGHKYERIIAMIYLTLLLAATVSAYKIVNVGFFPEPGSTLIFTSSYFFGTLVAELYGPYIAKQLIFEAIICGLIFGILIFCIDYLPSANLYLNNSKEYHSVLGNTLRFTVSGTIGFILSSYINIHLVSKWRKLLNGKYYIIRSLGSTAIGELVATFLAGFLTFLGMMPIIKIVKLMGYAYLFKICYDLFAIWPIAFVVYLLKKKEINVYNFSEKRDHHHSYFQGDY